VRRWAAGDPARAPVAEALGRLLPAFQAVRFGGGGADRALVDGLLAADADAARLLEPAP
jgi:hypothetical protein